MKKTIFALILGISVFATVGLAQEKLTPELWRRIDSEGPKPLPQSPAVKRETTDAEDEGLKGKVKRVIREYRSYTDVCAKRGSCSETSMTLIRTAISFAPFRLRTVGSWLELPSTDLSMAFELVSIRVFFHLGVLHY